jgi:hypothetical protein
MNGDWLTRWYAELTFTAWPHVAEPVTANPVVVPASEPLNLDARKVTGYIEVPGELLMDHGIIPDTREHKPVPWRTRFRWKRAQWREQAARIAYRAITGGWPCDGSDHY